MRVFLCLICFMVVFLCHIFILLESTEFKYILFNKKLKIS